MIETLTIPIKDSTDFHGISAFFDWINSRSLIHYIPKFLTEEMRKNYEEWKKNQH